MTWRIAVIQLDQDSVPVSLLPTAERVDFAELGVKLLQECEIGELNITTFNYAIDRSSLPSQDETYDVIYLTGSKKDSFVDDDFTIPLMKYIRQMIGKCKLIGICYGHQIIARSLGLTTLRNEHPQKWEMGSVLVQGGHFGEFTISEMHRDVVHYDSDVMQFLERKGIKSLGYSNDEVCKLQGMIQNGKILTFQGHPEFSKDLTMALAYDKYQRGLIDEDYFQNVKERYENVNIDQGKLHKIIREFIMYN